MSGYLDVKYPTKSSLGLPFKSWKKQWCILRPSSTCIGGGALAVYCSEAGASAGSVELPTGCYVRRTKSRSRPFAFAVYNNNDPCKPRILLATQTLQDTHQWMEKIKALLNVNKHFGTEALLKDSFSVTIHSTNLSRKCGLNNSDCVISLSMDGLLVSHAQKLGLFLLWKHLKGVTLTEGANKNQACLLTIDREFDFGSGEFKLSSPMCSELVAALKCAGWRKNCGNKLSRSEGDLRATGIKTDNVRLRSWYSGPSEISVDDSHHIVPKEWRQIGSGRFPPTKATLLSGIKSACNDNLSDRRSLASIASGIYEEIPDVPFEEQALSVKAIKSQTLQHQSHKADLKLSEEDPTYESVAECVYATMRRTGRRHPPPPLPPRLPFGSMKLGESWNTRANNVSENQVTRHSSMGSLPRCYSVSSASSAECPRTKTLDKTKHPFNAFRKRLKSDSRINVSPKSEAKEKKKRFDFAPTSNIFKNFRRKTKSQKANLGTSETKSCEYLDDAENRVEDNRCSKSVECLEGGEDSSDEFDYKNLSIELNENNSALALPQEIVDIIVRGREQLNKIRLKNSQLGESDYLPMSPVATTAPLTTAIEQHYIVMSPKSNVA